MTTKDEEQITMSKGELDALIDSRLKADKMPKEEARLREIVREEAGGEFRKALADFFKSADDDGEGEGESAGENDGGQASGVVGDLKKLVGL